MKKLLILLFVLFCAVLPARADVIWTPVDEYLSHCDYSSEIRSFIAAGEKGWVEAVDLPTDPSRTRRFPNGTEFLVETVCGQEDDRWAWIKISRYPWDSEFVYPDECFIPMNDLIQGYDSAVFAEIHRDELQPFEDDFDFCAQTSYEIRMTPDSALVLYETTPRKLGGCREGEDFKSYHQIESVYVDKDGNRWIPLKDLFSKPDGWINIGK